MAQGRSFSKLTAVFPVVQAVGSKTFNPGSIADGNEEATTVTATGAVLGDFVMVSFSVDVADLVLDGQVTAADTVTCVFANNTGGAIDLASGTLRVIVFDLNSGTSSPH